MRMLAWLLIGAAIQSGSLLGADPPPATRFEWTFDRNTKIDPSIGLGRIEESVKVEPSQVYVFQIKKCEFGAAIFATDESGNSIGKADDGEAAPYGSLSFVSPKSGVCTIAVVLRSNRPARMDATLRLADASEVEEHRRREQWSIKNQKGAALLRQGKLEDAAKELGELSSWTQRHFPPDAYPNGHPHLAACGENEGDVEIARGRLAEAEIVWRKVLKMRRGLFPAKRFPLGHPLVADTVNNLGYLIESQGRHSEAIELFRESLRLRQTLFPKSQFPMSHPDVANSWNNLGAAYASQGAVAEAELCYRDALSIREAFYSKELFPNGHPALAATMNNLAAALYDQGNNADADQVLSAVHAMYRRLYPEKQYPSGHPDLANALSNWAAVRLALGDLERADELHSAALKMQSAYFAPKGHPKGHPALARSLNNVGFVRLRQGESKAGEKLFRASLKMREQWFDAKQHPHGHLDVANSYDNLGLALLMQGECGQAESCFRKSAAMVRSLAGDSHALASSSLVHLADALRKQDRFDEALDVAEDAWRCYRLARLRAQASGLERTGFGADHSSSGLLAVLRAKAKKPTAAWTVFEEGCSQGLLDDVVGKASRPLSPEDRAREEELVAQIAERERLLLERSSISKESTDIALRKACEESALALLRFRQEIETRYGPRVGRSYELAKIQAVIPSTSAFIGWIDLAGNPQTGNGEEHWAFVLRSTGEPAWIQLSPLDGRTWNERDDRLIAAARRDLHDSDADWREQGQATARQRLHPLEPFLKGVRHLIVLPSIRMAGIPIEALSDHYLVSYAPSATLYAWLKEKPEPAKEGMLLVGNATYGKTAGGRSAGFQRLPGAAQEAALLSDWMKDRGIPVDAITAEDATASVLRKRIAANASAFRYLHIAAHGKASWERGLSSFLALGREHDSPAAFSRITAGEILRTWKLDADLVTLSACETGLGQQQGGEGYLGFSQALLSAGARTLVLSQGPVNDHAATLLMIRFYQELRPAEGKKRSKLEAFTAAVHWLRTLPRQEAVATLRGAPGSWLESLPPGHRPFEHPHFWATFVLIGLPD
ncbi:MAG: CHAT domain-containing tetratricopeptide repeat protein [Gemmataceae bacterium]